MHGGRKHKAFRSGTSLRRTNVVRVGSTTTAATTTAAAKVAVLSVLCVSTTSTIATASTSTNASTSANTRNSTSASATCTSTSTSASMIYGCSAVTAFTAFGATSSARRLHLAARGAFHERRDWSDVVDGVRVLPRAAELCPQSVPAKRIHERCAILSEEVDFACSSSVDEG